jgi:hypothetical protein
MEAKDVLKRLNSIILDQTIRSENLEKYFFMYGHSSLQSSYAPPFSMNGNRIRMNIIQSCADTLLNKISKNEPRPVFLTDNGDWGVRKKAEKREKFVFGQFYKSGTYKKAPSALLQALIFGDGLMKVYSKDKEIITEPTSTLELYIDDRQGLYGEPKELWQTRYMDKDTLKAMYPESASAIDNTPTELTPFFMSGSIHNNLVMVVEYWKLPDRKVSKDKYVGGKHMIICGDSTLLEEDWNRAGFPFAKISYVKNLIGTWAKGMAEILTPFQLQVNYTLKTISDSMRLMGSPKVLYEYNSKIINSHFNNDIGAMIGYLGTPPQFVTPSPVAQELFQFLGETVERAYAEVGISQLTASSQKPAGLNSGKALREYNDIETERFAALAKNYEQFFVDLSELVLLEAKDISKKHGKYAILAPNKNGCDVINFKDIDMDQDDYMIQVYPAAMLPKTPAGRLEYVQEMLMGGLIGPEEGLQLLDFPDTKKITKLKTSELDDIMATVDYMLDNDKYLPPEPFQNIEMGINLMKKAYLQYKNDGCPDEKLDLLIRWINDAIMMVESINQPAPDEMTSSDVVSSELEQPVPAVADLATTPDQAMMDEQLAQEQLAVQDATNQIV